MFGTHTAESESPPFGRFRPGFISCFVNFFFSSNWYKCNSLSLRSCENYRKGFPYVGLGRVKIAVDLGECVDILHVCASSGFVGYDGHNILNDLT